MVESAPLLREYTLIAYRGFESLSLRQIQKRVPSGALFCIWLSGRLDENPGAEPRFDKIAGSDFGRAKRHLGIRPLGEAQGCAEQSLSQIDSIALMPRTGQKIAKKGYAFAE